MTDLLNQQCGNYRLIRPLGSGGFADVYLGEHIYLKTRAAIKMLHTRLTQQALQAFLDEARTIANLKHHNIVQVLEFGVEKDAPFLVMTYAPNGTLRQRHPQGSRLSAAQVASYVGQVAAALQYAHGNKVIHRDVKPENMLIGQNGEILLSDFGIAVVAQSSRYTGQEVGGTAAYMAPEQLQGRAGPVSDQYALAVTAYEWLTGELPFTGSFAEICSQHLLVAPPPLRQKVPSISPAVEQAVLIALNKDPQRRFSSVQAFANALALASGANQGFGTATLSPATTTQQNEELIPTMLKPSSVPAPPLPPSFPYPASNPPLQQGNSPSFTYPAQSGNLMTPPLMQAGQTPPGQFPPQGPQGKRRQGNKGIWVALIALVVLLIAGIGAGGVYFFASQKTGGKIQTPPIAASTSSTQPGVTATSTSVPAGTPAASPGTTTQPVATVASGTSTKSFTLTCNQCYSDPVHVTINSIQIDDANGRTIWDTSLRDVTKSSQGFSFVTYELEASGSTTQVNAQLSQTQFSGTNQADAQAIFAFVPASGVTYTLTIVVNWAYNTANNIPFDPVKITFAPDGTPTVVQPQPAATVASGTITKNLTLTCSQCSSDPVHVTINSIQIDDADGRMVWDTSLKDVTNSDRGFSFVTYELEASGSTTQVNAVLSQTQFSGTNQADMQAIFAFVPAPGVTYTLTIVVNWAYNTANNIPFDPVKMTF